jgi:hypothetical protein
MIPPRALGCCGRCRTSLTYNIFDHPYCDRCDCIELAAVCYHCGAPVLPECRVETFVVDGFRHEIESPVCPQCGGWRADVEHLGMGNDTSSRLRARLARFVRRARFAVPFYARRLAGR